VSQSSSFDHIASATKLTFGITFLKIYLHQLSLMKILYVSWLQRKRRRRITQGLAVATLPNSLVCWVASCKWFTSTTA
jgi:hypothetical protein